MAKFSRGICPFLVFIFTALLGATSSASILSGINENRVQFSAEQFNYGTGGSLPEQQNQYVDFAPSIQYLRHFGSDTSRSVVGAEALAIIPASQGVGSQLAIPELYLNRSSSEQKLSFTVGRWRREWSALDEHSHLGLWQPLARWDSVRPISQGLTGLFVSFDDDLVRAVYFASPLYLPDQGPEYELKDGRFTSSNRWFRPPVDQAQIKNVETPIFYRIDTPAVSNIVNRTSQALMVEVGAREQGAFGRFAFADKPMNQFHLGLETTVSSGGDLNVLVHPYVVKHNLYSLETGYRFNEGSLLVSQTWERFENPNLSDKFQQSELIDSQYTGAVLTHDLSNFGWRRSSLDLSYVQRTKATSGAKDTLIVGGVESSSQRLTFARLAGVQFQKNIFRNFVNSLDTGLGYFYSLDDQGEWLHGDLTYKYDRQWVWNLSGDIFGASGLIDANASFISKFRGNDRMIGSFSYVF
jgi:hypothetical protein